MYRQSRFDEYWYNRPESILSKVWEYDWSERLSERTRHRLVLFGFGLFVVIPLLLYLFCRAFLVVEGFIGLRSLPALAFHTPEWTQYLAHL